jgi:hypothetical protein
MATCMTTMNALLSGVGDHYTASFPSDFLPDARDIPSELSIEHPTEVQQGVFKEESERSCQISYTELMRINGNLSLGKTLVSLVKKTRGSNRCGDENKTETWSMDVSFDETEINRHREMGRRSL